MFVFFPKKLDKKNTAFLILLEMTYNKNDRDVIISLLKQFNHEGVADWLQELNSFSGEIEFVAR